MFVRSLALARGRNQRGAVLVEAAIGLIVILIMAGGILNYGSVFASTIDASNALRAGTRTGSISTANGPTSDWEILQILAKKSGGDQRSILKVVIYKASDANGTPPAACLTAAMLPVGTSCNIYGPQHFAMSQQALAASANAQGWPVSSRVPGTDFLGVWIEVERKPFFRLVWAPDRFTDRYVVPLSPAAVVSSQQNWSAQADGEIPNFQNGWFCWGERGCMTSNGGDGSGGGSGGGSA